MITVKRGKETTAVQLDGSLRTIIYESLSVVEAIRKEIVEKTEDPEEVILAYVKDLINVAMDK